MSAAMQDALRAIDVSTRAAVKRAHDDLAQAFTRRPEDYRRFRLYRVLRWRIPETWQREPDFQSLHPFAEIRTSRAILDALRTAHANTKDPADIRDIEEMSEGEDFILSRLLDAAEARHGEAA